MEPGRSVYCRCTMGGMFCTGPTDALTADTDSLAAEIAHAFLDACQSCAAVEFREKRRKTMVTIYHGSQHRITRTEPIEHLRFSVCCNTARAKGRYVYMLEIEESDVMPADSEISNPREAVEHAIALGYHGVVINGTDYVINVHRALVFNFDDDGEKQ